MDLPRYTKSHKKHMPEHGIRTHKHKIDKKKSKRLMPPESNYKTLRKYPQPKEVPKSPIRIEDELQEGGGFFGNLKLKFKLRSLLKTIKKIFKMIDKISGKMKEFAKVYNPNKMILESLLNKRIEDVNYLIVRYQQLIANESQQKYFTSLQKNTPESMFKYYQSELNKIQNEHTIITNFMEEVNQRTKATESEIARIRKLIEGKNSIADNKLYKQFEQAYKAYLENMPRIQEINNQLEKASIHKKLTDEGAGGIDKKEAEETRIYASIFSKYSDKKNIYDKIMKDALENKKQILQYTSDIAKSQANYDAVNSDYKKQKENYNAISPILDGIFNIYIPKVVNRNLPQLNQTVSKLDLLIKEFNMKSGVIETNFVPALESCNEWVKNVQDRQRAIIAEIKKMSEEMFKFQPNSKELSKTLESLIQANNDSKPFLNESISSIEKLYKIIKNTQIGGVNETINISNGEVDQLSGLIETILTPGAPTAAAAPAAQTPAPATLALGAAAESNTNHPLLHTSTTNNLAAAPTVVAATTLGAAPAAANNAAANNAATTAAQTPAPATLALGAAAESNTNHPLLHTSTTNNLAAAPTVVAATTLGAAAAESNTNHPLLHTSTTNNLAAAPTVVAATTLGAAAAESNNAAATADEFNFSLFDSSQATPAVVAAKTQPSATFRAVRGANPMIVLNSYNSSGNETSVDNNNNRLLAHRTVAKQKLPRHMRDLMSKLSPEDRAEINAQLAAAPAAALGAATRKHQILPSIPTERRLASALQRQLTRVIGSEEDDNNELPETPDDLRIRLSEEAEEADRVATQEEEMVEEAERIANRRKREADAADTKAAAAKEAAEAEAEKAKTKQVTPAKLTTIVAEAVEKSKIVDEQRKKLIAIVAKKEKINLRLGNAAADLATATATASTAVTEKDAALQKLATEKAKLKSIIDTPSNKLMLDAAKLAVKKATVEEESAIKKFESTSKANEEAERVHNETVQEAARVQKEIEEATKKIEVAVRVAEAAKKEAEAKQKSARILSVTEQSAARKVADVEAVAKIARAEAEGKLKASAEAQEYLLLARKVATAARTVADAARTVADAAIEFVNIISMDGILVKQQLLNQKKMLLEQARQPLTQVNDQKAKAQSKIPTKLAEYQSKLSDIKANMTLNIKDSIEKVQNVKTKNSEMTTKFQPSLGELPHVIEIAKEAQSKITNSIEFANESMEAIITILIELYTTHPDDILLKEPLDNLIKSLADQIPMIIYNTDTLSPFQTEINEIIIKCNDIKKNQNTPFSPEYAIELIETQINNAEIKIRETNALADRIFTEISSAKNNKLGKTMVLDKIMEIKRRVDAEIETYTTTNPKDPKIQEKLLGFSSKIIEDSQYIHVNVNNVRESLNEINALLNKIDTEIIEYRTKINKDYKQSIETNVETAKKYTFTQKLEDFNNQMKEFLKKIKEERERVNREIDIAIFNNKLFPLSKKTKTIEKYTVNRVILFINTLELEKATADAETATNKFTAFLAIIEESIPEVIGFEKKASSRMATQSDIDKAKTEIEEVNQQLNTSKSNKAEAIKLILHATGLLKNIQELEGKINEEFQQLDITSSTINTSDPSTPSTTLSNDVQTMMDKHTGTIQDINKKIDELDEKVKENIIPDLLRLSSLASLKSSGLVIKSKPTEEDLYNMITEIMYVIIPQIPTPYNEKIVQTFIDQNFIHLLAMIKNSIKQNKIKTASNQISEYERKKKDELDKKHLILLQKYQSRFSNILGEIKNLKSKNTQIIDKPEKLILVLNYIIEMVESYNQVKASLMQTLYINTDYASSPIKIEEINNGGVNNVDNVLIHNVDNDKIIYNFMNQLINTKKFIEIYLLINKLSPSNQQSLNKFVSNLNTQYTKFLSVDGADGSDGSDGSNGSDGSDGADGADGADGSDGAKNDSNINLVLDNISKLLILLIDRLQKKTKTPFIDNVLYIQAILNEITHEMEKLFTIDIKTVKNKYKIKLTLLEAVLQEKQKSYDSLNQSKKKVILSTQKEIQKIKDTIIDVEQNISLTDQFYQLEKLEKLKTAASSTPSPSIDRATQQQINDTVQSIAESSKIVVQPETKIATDENIIMDNTKINFYKLIDGCDIDNIIKGTPLENNSILKNFIEIKSLIPNTASIVCDATQQEKYKKDLSQILNFSLPTTTGGFKKTNKKQIKRELNKKVKHSKLSRVRIMIGGDLTVDKIKTLKAQFEMFLNTIDSISTLDENNRQFTLTYSYTYFNKLLHNNEINKNIELLSIIIKIINKLRGLFTTDPTFIFTKVTTATPVVVIPSGPIAAAAAPAASGTAPATSAAPVTSSAPVTPATSITPTPRVASPLLLSTHDTGDDDDDDDNYVGIVMLNDFNEIIKKISSSLSSSSSSSINFAMQPPPGGLIGSQLQGQQGQQGSQYLVQHLLPGQAGQLGQLGQTGQVGNVNINQKQIVTNLSSLASNYFDSILVELKNTNAELDTQSDEFKQLNNKFRDMNKIQSSISLITAKIKLPETEKVTSYIPKLEVESKPSLTLKEILANPLNQQMKSHQATLIRKIEPEHVSDFARSKSVSQPQQSQYGAPLQQYPSPFGTPIQQQTASLLPQQGQQQIDSLLPQQGQQGLVQGSSYASAPYMNFIPGMNVALSTSYLPQEGKKLDLSKLEDKRVLEHEAELRRLIEVSDEKPFNDYLNDNIRSFSRHPYAYVFFASPMGLKWLKDTESGNKFLASPNNNKILFNIKRLLQDPRLTGIIGPNVLDDLDKIASKVLEDTHKAELLTELGTGIALKQLDESKAAVAAAKKK
jgi:hypothetical protein